MRYFVSLFWVMGLSAQSIDLQIAATKHGDTLFLTGEHKAYDIQIDKPITIIGNDADIDGQHKGSVFIITSDSVELSGLRIKNVGHSYTQDHAAIKINNASQIILQDNHIDKAFFGIYLERSKKVKIIGNTIRGDARSQSDSGNGIHVWNCKELVVQNNTVAGLRDGIYFEFVHDSQIENNQSHNNLRYGLHFMFSNHNTYSDNVFTQNGAGTAVMFSNHVQMRRNRFSHNWGSHAYGLLLKEVNDLVVEENIFESNTIGINAEGLNRIVYRYNLFKNNGWAVKFRGACTGNRFSKNNFIDNAFDISYTGPVHDNRFVNNYWSRYQGYDLNKDKMGDVPYRPVKLFSVIINKTPEALVLLKSMFVGLLNHSEQVSPIFTPS
ncbi:MAG: nitrous oxide reductase family maturation protein NosD, partial [Flavobacteriaceae bacterium]